MNEYYGIAPSSDFFAHYGVKGMKWGVRKAIERGNDRKLSRQFRKAEKKLARLQAKADRSAILQRANRLDKVSKGARIAGRVGLGAAAAATGAHHLSNVVSNNTMKWATGLKNGKVNEAVDSVYNSRMNKIGVVRDASRYAQAAGAGVAALGYGAAIGSKVRANALRRRANNATKMREAQAKANAFRKEMNQAFAGTKYARKNRRG